MTSYDPETPTEEAPEHAPSPLLLAVADFIDQYVDGDDEPASEAY